MARYFPGESISKIHGKPRKENNVVYYPMYHPAAALHQGSLRQMIEADMLRVPRILAEFEQVPQGVGARQLELF